MLANYVVVYNHRFEKHKATLLQAFRNAYGGQEKLAHKLVSMNKSTDLTTSIELEIALSARWFEKGWNRENAMTTVFNLTPENWFSNSMAPLLVRYSSYYSERNPGQKPRVGQ
ncbi:hypothetical protein F444_16030 [Phytophthora nicotianae P1976]|uniref:RxLR effector protein n=1 Tax=Phytophthora nicotianae P1976 TaxID=1317066 RepID=A0A080ZJV3_PHYNI|nr:hypothetical protein F444_16030 [Phytophthora nicotianae P1976]